MSNVSGIGSQANLMQMLRLATQARPTQAGAAGGDVDRPQAAGASQGATAAPDHDGDADDGIGAQVDVRA